MRGLGWFRAGAIVWLLAGALHLLAIYNAVWGVPTDPAELRFREAARDFRVELGPIAPSGWDGMLVLSWSWSVTMFALAGLDLLVAGLLRRTGDAAGLRAASTANALAAIALLAVSIAYTFPPPAVFALLAAVAFAGARLRAPSC